MPTTLTEPFGLVLVGSNASEQSKPKLLYRVGNS
jgi:hypothetical protein